MNQQDSLGSASQAPRDRASRNKGTTGVPAVGQHSGAEGPDLEGTASRTYLAPRTGRGHIRSHSILEPGPAARWQQKREMRVARPPAAICPTATPSPQGTASKPRLHHEVDAPLSQPHVHQDTWLTLASNRSVIPTIPPIEKWTVLSLRQALINSEVHFSQRLNKAELYNLYVTLQSANLTPKSIAAPKSANRASTACKARSSPRSIPLSSHSTSGPTQASGRKSRPSASLGHA
ncbi:translation initiation factor IF-2-like protein [Labeo rohita]|uniref:Translation initiation factor IF-2-like protein n=1 Tax=Labeo rohita TaxID=84645 RepID=A0A498NDU5_LABRO|nr:translation initiation factor IF-2-like protein [Labeo rohita]